MYPKTKPPGSGFAAASLVLAIVAIASTLTMTVVIPVFFGILSIFLGLLSRGNQKLPNNALAGLIVSASAIMINLAVGAFAFYVVFFFPRNASAVLGYDEPDLRADDGADRRRDSGKLRRRSRQPFS